MKQEIHLLANSHLDPVWLWEWPEGLSAALALARAAVGLCENERGFVFNRGEAQFYEWIEEYDPALFERVRVQVAAGRWWIMGGWYVQCDCNMPAGESIVRQVERGLSYFADRFGVQPRTAVNLDPFGHSRGLVQVLARNGYDSYLFCRPDCVQGKLPAAEFRWVGYDGSEVIAVQGVPHYNSAPGKTVPRVNEWLKKFADRDYCLIPWGVGNHGGGPASQDFADLEQLAQQRPEIEFIHSTPERYVKRVREDYPTLPLWAGDLNPFAVGCYTSMALVKQGHRQLENELFLTEKIATTAWLAGRLDWPEIDFNAAEKDLLFSQFHDCLPGSAVEPVAGYLLRRLGHGRELLEQIKVKALYKLVADQRPAAQGEFPYFVYNPHPCHVQTIIEWELQEDWPNEESEPLGVVLRGEGGELPAQMEQPCMNINEDHRKRLVFVADLPPGQVSRFDCRLLPGAGPGRWPDAEDFTFACGSSQVVVNRETGLLDRFSSAGVELLAPGSCRPVVMADNEDPWGMQVTGFQHQVGEFTLAEPEATARISGLREKQTCPVKVVENGPVRVVVEVIFTYGDSYIRCHYKIPRTGLGIEVDLLINWREKDRMLKWLLPTAFPAVDFLGQTVFGVQSLARDGAEVCAQKWVALPGTNGPVLACINEGLYGFSCVDRELAVSLLRSPAYAGHPKGDDDRWIVPPDRYTPRMDLGERRIKLWLLGDHEDGLLDRLDHLSLQLNERPVAANFFPHGKGERVYHGPVISDQAIRLSAFRVQPDKGKVMLRLFETTGKTRQAKLKLPTTDAAIDLGFTPYEIKTIHYDPETRGFTVLDQPPRVMNK